MWRLDDDLRAVTGTEAAALLAERAAEGVLETWFTSDDGPTIGVTTNRERASVIVMAEVGDPGKHAIDPAAGTGASTGFRMNNGQVDRYPDRDTVPFPVAQRIVREVVDTGDADVPWHDDRGPGEEPGTG